MNRLIQDHHTETSKGTSQPTNTDRNKELKKSKQDLHLHLAWARWQTKNIYSYSFMIETEETEEKYEKN